SVNLVVYNTHELPFPFGDALICATIFLLVKPVGDANHPSTILTSHTLTLISEHWKY
ncbi:5717_t:CDS:1, partial [Funneliformis caledonium]